MKFLITLALSCLPIIAYAYDDLSASSRISAEGLHLQSQRLKIIAQNIANADTTGRTVNELPYTRKSLKVAVKNDATLNAQITKIEGISRDKSEYKLKYEPYHPAANAEGYVRYPNVDTTLEMADAKEAQRSYEANLSALEIAKANKAKILEALK